MARTGYDEGCLAAHALDLIGDRWALLVLRELMLGPKRFGQIKAGMPGIATNVLTQRLGDLEAGGLLQRRLLPPPAAVPVYALTGAGYGARGVIDALCRWGVCQPGHDPTKFISPTGLMLSMAVMARPVTLAAPIRATFDMGSECFAATLSQAGFSARPEAEPVAALRFEGSGNSLAAAVYGPVPLASLLEAGRIGFHGDVAAGQAFLDHFVLAADTPSCGLSSGMLEGAHRAGVAQG